MLGLRRVYNEHTSAFYLVFMFFSFHGIKALLAFQRNALIKDPELAWTPGQVTSAPKTCETCTDPPTTLTANSTDMDENNMTCYWPQWPTSKPRKGHSVTFMVSHLISKERVQRNLDHLQDTFTAPDIADRVRTIIGVIDKDAGTICIGHRPDECVPRVVLSEERRQAILDLYKDHPEEKRVYFRPDGMQQTTDFVSLYRLYESKCSGQDDPVLWSFLDNDMAACPGFGYHLTAITHYSQYSLAARSGRPFALRTASGSNGVFMPTRFVGSLMDTLKWISDGDGPQWRHAADNAMDLWAKGELVAPTQESEPRPVGFFQYYMTLFDHLGNSDSYFWDEVYLSKRTTQLSYCGMGLSWTDNKAKKNDECFGQAWRPCTPDRWGEYVIGFPLEEDVPPSWYVDMLESNSDNTAWKAQRRWWRAAWDNWTAKTSLVFMLIPTYAGWRYLSGFRSGLARISRDQDMSKPRSD